MYATNIFFVPRHQKEWLSCARTRCNVNSEQFIRYGLNFHTGLHKFVVDVRICSNCYVYLCLYFAGTCAGTSTSTCAGTCAGTFLKQVRSSEAYSLCGVRTNMNECKKSRCVLLKVMVFITNQHKEIHILTCGVQTDPKFTKQQLFY